MPSYIPLDQKFVAFISFSEICKFSYTNTVAERDEVYSVLIEDSVWSGCYMYIN